MPASKSLRRWRVFLPPSADIFLILAMVVVCPTPAISQPATAQKVAKVEIVVEPNGTFTQTMHIEIQALNDTAARSLAQQAFTYSESLQELEIVEAYTQKADGRKLPVDPSAIFPQLPQGASQLPMFNDQRQKTIVFSDGLGGDTIALTVKQHQKEAQFPGQFTTFAIYPKTISYNDVDESISAPKEMPLQIEAHGITTDTNIEGDRVVYHWHYKAPNALTEEPTAVSLFDISPRVYVSSFKNFDDLASTYSSLAHDKILITPKVQAIADDVTKGISDRRLQTQKIYEWVSKHVRYVAIYFGNGGLIPHDPDTIIANGYGDCKDHTVLFASLLKAKGINSELVLVNLDNSYTIPSGAPLIAQLNHLINWITEFNLYTDTTAAVAPFGSLPLAEYGKPAILAVVGRNSLTTIPILPAGAFSTSIRTATKLSADGKLSGTTTVTGTGPASIALRIVAIGIQSIGVDRAVKSLFGTNSTGTLDFAPPEVLGPEYSITAHFDLEANTSMVSGDRFYLPPGMRIIEKAGEGLMGPFNADVLKKINKLPCYSGHQQEYLSLELPPGKHVASPPFDKHVKNSNMEFNSHWDHDLHSISVHRDFLSKVDEPFCEVETLSAAATALDQIWDDYNSSIWLTDNISDGPTTKSPPDMQEFDETAARILNATKKNQN